MRIRATRDPAAATALVSRFAGNGVLPRNVAWPTWDCSALYGRWVNWCEHRLEAGIGSPKFLRDTIARHREVMRENPKPIHFLAMVRLRDVGPFTRELDLPESGALLFFYDVERSMGALWPEGRGGWQVFHTEEDDAVLIEHAPVQLPDSAPSTLAFEMQYTLPNDLCDETGDGDLRVYRNDEYTRLYDALSGGNGRDGSHQLGGAPQEVQHDLFYHCQLVSNGLDCGEPSDREHPRVAELARGAKDWRLLLQIDSDERGPGWMWGDAGRLYFCLHRDDLAARRFDRVWADQQCG